MRVQYLSLSVPLIPKRRPLPPPLMHTHLDGHVHGWHVEGLEHDLGSSGRNGELGIPEAVLPHRLHACAWASCPPMPAAINAWHALPCRTTCLSHLLAVALGVQRGLSQENRVFLYHKQSEGFREGCAGGVQFKYRRSRVETSVISRTSGATRSSLKNV